MKTADRILATALELFNEQGVAHVTTNAIADAADLSVGNLYYHFKNKDDILVELVAQFNRSIDDMMSFEESFFTLERWAIWWHVWFDAVERFSFLFHDQRYLQQLDRRIKRHLQCLCHDIERKQKAIFGHLKEQGELVATDADLARLSHQVTFIALFWLDYVELSQAKQKPQTPFASALQQTLGLLLPYMRSDTQLTMECLIRQAEAL